MYVGGGWGTLQHLTGLLHAVSTTEGVNETFKNKASEQNCPVENQSATNPNSLWWERKLMRQASKDAMDSFLTLSAPSRFLEKKKKKKKKGF